MLVALHKDLLTNGSKLLLKIEAQICFLACEEKQSIFYLFLLQEYPVKAKETSILIQ